MLKNLTPHKMVVLGEDGKVLAEIPPSGEIARVEARVSRRGEVDGLPVYNREFGQVLGLPAREEGVTLLVSALVAQASPRADVMSPGELVRNSEGQPSGCRGLTASL